VHAARTPSEVLESVERFFVDRSAVARKEERTAALLVDPDPVGAARSVDRSAVTRSEDPAHGPSEHARIAAAFRT